MRPEPLSVPASERARAALVAERLAPRLKLLANVPPVVAGFDGFVDELIAVVGERRGADDWTAMTGMAELGRLITGAAGRNSLREIVVKAQDAGGCAVNLGDGLMALDVCVDYVGTVGNPRHPAFDAFAARCRSCSPLGKVYGRTLAFEFGDGKFMFSAVGQLGEITPELVRDHLRDGAFARACAGAGLIALTNWTLYPHMTAVWKLLQKQVFSTLSHRPWLFVDLVDPSSRAEADIHGMLAALSVFQTSCEVVLGVNLTEATVLGRLLGIGAPGGDSAGFAAHAARLRTRLSVAEVVIHHTAFNAVAHAGGAFALASGPYTPTPRKSTGAGDRFNAGYCLGLLAGYAPDERLALGAATSGFFVRAARSGDRHQVAGFLTDWGAGSVG